MTVKEAIEWFEKAIDVYEIFPIENDFKLEAFRLAVDALKKQIPKKPLFIDGRYCCPSCQNNNRALNIYCDVCGNLLDWSDK